MSGLTRRKPLQRRKPLRGTRTLGRKRIRRERMLPEKPTRRHPAPKGPDNATVLVIVARATVNGVLRCEVCGEPIHGSRGYDWSIHHRRHRDGKPDSHTAPNLLLVGGADNVSGCHGRIHQNGRWAKANGLSLSRAAGVDPLTEPASLAVGRVYLTADGGYAAAPALPGVEAA